MQTENPKKQPVKSRARFRHFITGRFSPLLICSVLAIRGAASLGNASPISTIHRVVVVGGTHGNEYTGVWCIKALERSATTLRETYPSLDVKTLLGNPRAHLENKRFVHTDLNREFSVEKLGGNEGHPDILESLRAREIDSILGPKFDNDPQTDVVIDLHSTTSNMGITLIVPQGDVVMSQAAAYVLQKCGGEEGGARCLMHTIPDRDLRPNLSSAAKHGFTVEVGPVPQGVIRHDAVEKTQKVIALLLEFLDRRNQGEDVLGELSRHYGPSHQVPCFVSAPASRPGEMSGKITWPSDPENPNFPLHIVHRHLQDRDFQVLRKGDPLFVTLDGSVINYDGSHGDEVYLIFVNEGGYYYQSSGTGIGVAVKAHFDLNDASLTRSDLECATFAANGNQKHVNGN